MSASTPPPVVAAAAASSSSSRSKKPTFVPLTDARSLLRPKKSTIDYHEPRLSSLTNDSPYGPPQVTNSKTTATTTTATTMAATIPNVPGASSTFSFDNHTPESAAYGAASMDGNKTATATTASKAPAAPTPGVDIKASSSSSSSSTGTAADPHGGQYTILRIKRKRHEEPLDMLVVQELLGGKKAKTLDNQADEEVSNTLAGMQTLPKTINSSSSSSSVAAPPAAAIFRFAATVNEASFKDPAQSIQLRDKITRIQNNPSSSSSPSPLPSSTSSTAAAAAAARPRSRLGIDRPDRRSFIGGVGGNSNSNNSSSSGASTPTPSSQARGELAGKMQSEAKMARYRVVQKNRTSLVMSEGQTHNNKKTTTTTTALASALQGPPEVKAMVQVEAEAALNMFNMLDAVKEELPKTKKQLEDEAIESDIMCNFLPMVKEYLSISEKTGDSSIVTDDKDGERRAPFSRFDQLLAETGQNDSDDEEDEYVYDIYYRDMNADQSQASQYRAVGSLLWYENDGEENFIHEEDSSADDYEDSDSNAEDYYQNDYPDEEEDSDQYAYELSDTDDDEYIY
ncbi:hypothetical protein DFQ27_002236 [Actinomortierella ambigua]|uniref:Probable RNA polymerase II nuclear localization protein SLC7A6OS n=1 Tax=Actinomortierella ambigua TaxID=1343610 RepID=A0A9P6Q868_9FUNG|nr:hypothetical protein DFQ27_002236 [Actinomortierella ambigua]